MQNKNLSLSSLSILIVGLFFVTIRLNYFTNNSVNGYNATSWDAFGYYAYLPSTFIYKDLKKLDWYPEIEKKYHVSGGFLYQADTLKNGNLTFKYLGGVAVIQTPFFLLGHGLAHASEAPEDGFSWPYQYAILWGAIFYVLLGFFILRKVLLRYFSDGIVATTLLLLGLATNLVQYTAVDGAMSHSFIFPLYSLLLWWTIRWHETAKWKYAIGLGLVIGLATISRPTEFIMFFIPLLWLPQENPAWQTKKAFLRKYRIHILYALLGGIIGILPQLVYWKISTGSWVHDVGSKWYFFNPWFRVLFGFTKGWFIYTPIALAMVIGLFFMRGRVFRKAILTFCILNVWIIISWSDWRYGASYSARAFVQSYPVFAFGLACLLLKVQSKPMKLVFAGVAIYLCGLNIFQIWQYNKGILHYDHMNYAYYKAIYWDKNPTPLDYSLMDSCTYLPNDFKAIETKSKNFNDSTFIWNIELIKLKVDAGKSIHVQASLQTTKNINASTWRLDCYEKGKFISSLGLRTNVPFVKDGKNMQYEAYFHLPKNTDEIIWNLGSFDTVKVDECFTKVEIGN